MGVIVSTFNVGSASLATVKRMYTRRGVIKLVCASPVAADVALQCIRDNGPMSAWPRFGRPRFVEMPFDFERYRTSFT